MVTGKKTFRHTLSVRDLRVVYLDKVPVKNLVTSGGDQIISGSTVFSRIIAQTLILSPGGTVGGIDLSEEVVALNNEIILGVSFL